MYKWKTYPRLTFYIHYWKGMDPYLSNEMDNIRGQIGRLFQETLFQFGDVPEIQGV